MRKRYPQFEIHRDDFYEQVKSALELSADVAEKYQEEMQAVGRRAIFAMMPASEVDPLQVYWTETRWKIKSDDLIGPYVLTRDDGLAIRGIAIWREQTENNT